jgi:hypothetical protein
MDLILGYVCPVTDESYSRRKVNCKIIKVLGVVEQLRLLIIKLSDLDDC